MKRTLLFRCAALFVLLACSEKEIADSGMFKPGVSVGRIDNKEINEASGLAASAVNPGMLWTHNDSGDVARIFLIDSLARYQMTVFFEGVEHRDWEDIAVGPGPVEGKSYIYVGDIGDNSGQYEYKYIYRIEEPVRAMENQTAKEIDAIKFKLPDGPRDAEALMIDPLTKDLYIFSKREKAINLYRLPYPQSTTEEITAELVYKEIPMTKIVAADWSADGMEILIKTYKKVFYLTRAKNEPLKKLSQKKPTALPYVEEPQGESVAFARSGAGYYTLSEKTKGRKPELMFYERVPAAAMQKDAE